MSTAAAFVRRARAERELTQQQLAARLGTGQPVIARLESARSDPRVSTLERALRSAGYRLALVPVPPAPGVDPALLAEHLALSPDERLRAFEALQAGVEDLVGALRPA